mmetsp:Transcript_23389/g.88808  ORF Transcript_23389/g.88808 Transcript_23389/m.88808 type:complete len:261 (-) Transcript_23389:438-1220(-)
MPLRSRAATAGVVPARAASCSAAAVGSRAASSPSPSPSPSESLLSDSLGGDGVLASTVATTMVSLRSAFSATELPSSAALENSERSTPRASPVASTCAALAARCFRMSCGSERATPLVSAMEECSHRFHSVSRQVPTMGSLCEATRRSTSRQASGTPAAVRAAAPDGCSLTSRTRRAATSRNCSDDVQDSASSASSSSLSSAAAASALSRLCFALLLSSVPLEAPDEAADRPVPGARMRSALTLWSSSLAVVPSFSMRNR